MVEIGVHFRKLSQN